MTKRWLSVGLTRDMARLAFRDYLGVGDDTADVLVSLFEAKGEAVDSRSLCVSVNSHRPIRMGALHERIRCLREAMDSEAIDSDKGWYSLTDVGMAECRQALGESARAMVLSSGGDLAELAPSKPRKRLRSTVLQLQAGLFDAA